MTWQAHVYGAAGADLAGWCAANRLPLHVFAWRPEYETTGLARGAVYLMRPDTYVALADPAGSAQALESYLAARGFEIGPGPGP
jgi:hypothetical protein